MSLTSGAARGARPVTWRSPSARTTAWARPPLGGRPASSCRNCSPVSRASRSTLRRERSSSVITPAATPRSRSRWREPGTAPFRVPDDRGPRTPPRRDSEPGNWSGPIDGDANRRPAHTTARLGFRGLRHAAAGAAPPGPAHPARTRPRGWLQRGTDDPGWRGARTGVTCAWRGRAGGAERACPGTRDCGDRLADRAHGTGHGPGPLR